MAIDNPQNIETSEQNTISSEPDLETAAADTAEMYEGDAATDHVEPPAVSAEPPLYTPADQVNTSGEKRKPWKWVAAGVAVVAAAAVTVAAIAGGGGDSKPRKADADPTEETAENPTATTSLSGGNETAARFTPLEILPTVEKSPEEVTAAHIELQLLAENTMSGDLMPYVHYDTNPATNSYMQDTLELIHTIRDGRGALGPVGVYLDKDGIESISAARVPGGELGDDISAEVVQRNKIIQWEPDQKSFVEIIDSSHYRIVLRQKIVNGRTYRTQVSYQKLEDDSRLSSRPISRAEAEVPFKESFKQLEAVEKDLGIEYAAAPEPN